VKRLKQSVKKALKHVGVNGDIIRVPHYWIPSNFNGGHAWNPISVTMELTYRCNLACQMCPQTKERSTMTNAFKNELATTDIKKLIDELAQMKVKSLTFTGGEPLLRKDIFEIIQYVKMKQMNCNILTNGALINERMAEGLVKTGADVVSISIDGPEEVHDYIRAHKGCFDNIAKGIALLQHYKEKENSNHPEIGLVCTISALNQNRLNEIIDFAAKLKIKKVTYAYMFYTNDDAINQTKELVEIGISKKESQNLPEYLKLVNIEILSEEVNKCIQKGKAYGVNVSFMPPLRSKEQIGQRFYSVETPYVNKCFYPWYASRINPSGDVYPCSIDVRIGNITEASFKELWNSDKYVKFRRTLKREKLFPKCAKCCVLTKKFWSYLPMAS
jgi:MoaA/NifB/PqqE/SkfB family radical SAM enzyme